MDLKEIYENKTGKDPWFKNELTGTYGLTQDYAEWLEKQLNIGGVVKSLKDLKVLPFEDWLQINKVEESYGDYIYEGSGVSVEWLVDWYVKDLLNL